MRTALHIKGLFVGLVFAISSFFILFSTASIAKSQKDIDAVGLAFAEAFNNKDVAAITKLIDYPLFAETIARTLSDNEISVNQFKTGFLSHGTEQLTYNIFTSTFNQNGQAIFVRSTKDKRPIVRVDFPEAGHEYFILILNNSVKQYKIKDILLLSSGREMSSTIGSISQLMLAPSDSILKKLFGTKEINKELLESFKAIGEYKRSGNMKKAYKILATLPEELKKERVIIDLGIQLAMMVSDDEYRKQLSRLERYYGSDPSAAFMLIDHHYYNEDYTKAAKSVQGIIDKYGTDGALQNLKATSLMLGGKLDKAKVAAAKGMNIEPSFEPVYWVYANILVYKKEYPELVAHMKQISSRFGYEFAAENFEADELYQGFVQSAAFKQWMQVN